MKELSTVLKWGKEGIIGHKIETFESKQHVTKTVCNLCAKYQEQIVNHPTCKGAAVITVKACTNGTKVVTKHQVTKGPFEMGECHVFAGYRGLSAHSLQWVLAFNIIRKEEDQIIKETNSIIHYWWLS